jgi:ATP-dependent Clp protease adaptor protein ClpS
MKHEVNKVYTTDLEHKEELLEPNLYQVVVENDDFTPMEFVVSILERFFYMDRRKAVEKMLDAHVKGRAVCGLFSKDIAESKIVQVMTYAELHDHPLRCDIEVA